jgi:hypothetical protein
VQHVVRIVIGLRRRDRLRAVELRVDVAGEPRIRQGREHDFRTALRLDGTDPRLTEFVRVFQLLTGVHVDDPAARTVPWERLRLARIRVGFVERRDRRHAWFDLVRLALPVDVSPPQSINRGGTGAERQGTDDA